MNGERRNAHARIRNIVASCAVAGYSNPAGYSTGIAAKVAARERERGYMCAMQMKLQRLRHSPSKATIGPFGRKGQPFQVPQRRPTTRTLSPQLQGSLGIAKPSS